MKRILLVNHYWPPTGGPAVQRWLDLSRELIDYGHTVDLVTPVDAAFPWYDESLLARVPAEVVVHRVGANSTVSNARKWVGDNKVTRFIRGNFFLPDPRKPWNKHALAFIEPRLADYDLLITAGPPQSTHLIGLAVQTKIPWVADLHDSWTDSIYLKDFYRTKLARWVDQKSETKVLEQADLILAHSRYCMDIYRKRTSTPIELVWVGFHEGHYASPAPEIKQNLISHVGSIYGPYQSAVDSVSLLQKEGFTFRQIGNVHPSITLPEGTIVSGYLSHPEAIKAARESEELLLINPFAHMLPGKIFEYLAAGRPIRCLVPEGSELRNLAEVYGGADPEVVRNEFGRAAIGKRLAKTLDEM